MLGQRRSNFNARRDKAMSAHAIAKCRNRVNRTVMNSFIWIAVVLVLIWIVARVVLAITSVFLHLFWVLAIVFLLVWLVKKFL